MPLVFYFQNIIPEHVFVKYSIFQPLDLHLNIPYCTSLYLIIIFHGTNKSNVNIHNICELTITKKRRLIHSHVSTATYYASAIFQHFSTFQYSPFSYPVIPVSPVLFFLSQTAFPVFSLLPSPSDTVPLIPDTLPTVQSFPP